MTLQSDHRDHRTTSSRPATLADWFAHVAQLTAQWTGHPTAFLLALIVIVVWIVTGPIFGYSDTWQLVINTGTTIVTFLMVFLIQNTQNRDMMAVQLKLSELVLAMKGAENKFAAVEDLSDEDLQRLHDECRARVEMTGQHLERRHGVKHGNGGGGGNGNPKTRAAKARRRGAPRSPKS